MEQTVNHSVRYSLLGPRLASVTRKPVRRPREKARRLQAWGAIMPLPRTFRKRGAARAVVVAGADLATSGVREQEWVRSHWREYAGKWVALDNSGLVAEAANARAALEKAKTAGVPFPFLIHVTEPTDLPFGGW